MFTNPTICRIITKFLVQPEDDLLWKEYSKNTVKVLRYFNRQFESSASELSRFHIFYDVLDVLSILIRHPNGIYQLHIEECPYRNSNRNSDSEFEIREEEISSLLDSPIASLIFEKCTISCFRSPRLTAIQLQHCRINLRYIQRLVLTKSLVSILRCSTLMIA